MVDNRYGQLPETSSTINDFAHSYDSEVFVNEDLNGHHGEIARQDQVDAGQDNSSMTFTLFIELLHL